MTPVKLEDEVIELIDRHSAKLSLEEYADFLSALISNLEMRDHAASLRFWGAKK